MMYALRQLLSFLPLEQKKCVDDVPATAVFKSL